MILKSKVHKIKMVNHKISKTMKLTKILMNNLQKNHFKKILNKMMMKNKKIHPIKFL